MAADVIQFIKSGEIADQTMPKWFSGTIWEFVQLYAKQAFVAGKIFTNDYR